MTGPSRTLRPDLGATAPLAPCGVPRLKVGQTPCPHRALYLDHESGLWHCYWHSPRVRMHRKQRARKSYLTRTREAREAALAKQEAAQMARVKARWGALYVGERGAA